MATNSSIEWTESTWNPVTGCTKISAGCANCYAARMAKRLHAMGQENYRNGFEVTCHPQVLAAPFKWKKPQMIFVNSMSDRFHEDVPEPFIHEIFYTMAKPPCILPDSHQAGGTAVGDGTQAELDGERLDGSDGGERQPHRPHRPLADRTLLKALAHLGATRVVACRK